MRQHQQLQQQQFIHQHHEDQSIPKYLNGAFDCLGHVNVKRTSLLSSQHRERAGERHQQQHVFHSVNAFRATGLLHFDGGPQS